MAAGRRAGAWPGPEVGWGLIASAQGKGYAAESAEAAINWVFDDLGWDHVIHCIDCLNTPSIKLAERLGSQRQRQNVPLPSPFDMHSVDIYGQTRDAWRSRSAL